MLKILVDTELFQYRQLHLTKSEVARFDYQKGQAADMIAWAPIAMPVPKNPPLTVDAWLAANPAFGDAFGLFGQNAEEGIAYQTRVRHEWNR